MEGLIKCDIQGYITCKANSELCNKLLDAFYEEELLDGILIGCNYIGKFVVVNSQFWNTPDSSEGAEFKIESVVSEPKKEEPKEFEDYYRGYVVKKVFGGGFIASDLDMGSPCGKFTTERSQAKRFTRKEAFKYIKENRDVCYVIEDAK